MGVNWNSQICRKTPPGMVQPGLPWRVEDVTCFSFVLASTIGVEFKGICFAFPMRCKMLHEITKRSLCGLRPSNGLCLTPPTNWTGSNDEAPGLPGVHCLCGDEDLTPQGWMSFEGECFCDPGRSDQTFMVISFDVARQGLQVWSWALVWLACRLRPCSSGAEATRRDEPADAGEPFRILGPGLDSSLWWFELLVILKGNTSKGRILDRSNDWKKISEFWNYLPRHQLYPIIYSNWQVPGAQEYYIGGDSDEDSEDSEDSPRSVSSQGCGPRGLGFLWVLVHSVWHGHKYIKSASRTNVIIDLVNQSSSWKFIYVHLAPHCRVVLPVAEMKRMGTPWWCIRSGATPKGLV